MVIEICGMRNVLILVCLFFIVLWTAAFIQVSQTSGNKLDLKMQQIIHTMHQINRLESKPTKKSLQSSPPPPQLEALSEKLKGVDENIGVYRDLASWEEDIHTKRAMFAALANDVIAVNSEVRRDSRETDDTLNGNIENFHEELRTHKDWVPESQQAVEEDENVPSQEEEEEPVNHPRNIKNRA